VGSIPTRLTTFLSKPQITIQGTERGVEPQWLLPCLIAVATCGGNATGPSNRAVITTLQYQRVYAAGDDNGQRMPTSPCTSVRRKSRPWKRYVNRV